MGTNPNLKHEWYLAFGQRNLEVGDIIVGDIVSGVFEAKRMIILRKRDDGMYLFTGLATFAATPQIRGYDLVSEAAAAIVNPVFRAIALNSGEGDPGFEEFVVC